MDADTASRTPLHWLRAEHRVIERVLGVLTGLVARSEQGEQFETDSLRRCVEFFRHFVFALEAQGLGSCCLNWPDLERQERRMDTLLRLEPDERVIMLVALGYPDPEGLVAYSQKKPLDELRSYNITG